MEGAALKAMLNDAQSYRKASQVLRLIIRKKNDFQLLGPLVVNANLAAEIYLKTLLAARLKTVVRGHRLDALYRSVPPADKECIEALYNLRAKRNPYAMRRQKSADAGADSSLETLIATAADAFVKWRYLYEPKDPSAPTFIFDLVDALDEYVAAIVAKSDVA